MGDTGGPYPLGQLAEALGAVLEGGAERVIRGVAPLETAGPDQISFVTHPKYLPLAASSRAGALLVARDVKEIRGPLLRAASPQAALIALLKLFHPSPPLTPGIHPSALVASDSRVHASASVGAFAVIQPRALIGARARIFPLVYAGGRATQKIPQGGGGIVEDDVEIGANVALDRATLGDTVVRRGTKIDNLVQ